MSPSDGNKKKLGLATVVVQSGNIGGSSSSSRSGGIASSSGATTNNNASTGINSSNNNVAKSRNTTAASALKVTRKPVEFDVSTILFHYDMTFELIGRVVFVFTRMMRLRMMKRS